ncbi:MAG: beta-lactamase family protein [Gammaproteobacteria bacterium]|nr:beta-lactamase family protein [Gammaproteobacteria bacterium]
MKIDGRWALLVLVACLVPASFAGSLDLPTAKPEDVGMSGDRLARITPVMQGYIDRKLVPGVITAVVRRGKLVHLEVQGAMDAESGVPMREDAIFRIASMTKPITSVALMMLWEEGRFQLSDPVSKFLPEFASPTVSTTRDASGKTGELIPVERPITIRDMLTHTAGLANNYIGNTAFYQETMQPQGAEKLDSYIRRLAALPLNYQPGTAWEYSGATDVVGRLVEVISGQPLDVFLRERIFKPLQMPDTHFWLDESHAPRLTTQYKPGEDLTIVRDDPGGAASRWITGPKTLFRGAGGLASTTRDYLRFHLMMLNEGVLDGVRLLAPGTVELMTRNHTGDLKLWLAGPGTGFGLGYGVVLDRGAAATPLSEGAYYWGGAYCTLSWVDPEEELIGIVMTQVRPYTHINIRQDFQVLVHSAIID